MNGAASGEFDYIIVGAGSAGCVLANRLTASGRYRVLLLEAGPPDRNPWIHVPLGYGKLFSNAAVNWCYESEPQAELHGRCIVQPRGKVLGGSSSINGLVYIRGQREDFERWHQLGNTGWGWEDVLPYFKRSERQMRGASALHGGDGPMAVSDPTESHPLCDAFLEAAADCGIPRNDDFNGVCQEGAGYYQTTSQRGRRCSAAVAYLRPIMGRHNLCVCTDALAVGLEMQGRRVIGVRWRRGERYERTVARVEVLLCAGAINSPQLLQLSGIGPPDLLKAHGIDVVAASPGVGEDLQDHFQVRCIFRCTRKITFNDDFHSPLRMLRVGLRYLFARRGPLTICAGYAGAFIRSTPDLQSPDTQLFFINYSTGRMGDQLHDFSAFTVSCCQLRPESRGRIAIVSSDPRVPPAIDPRYLSNAVDQRASVAGLRAIRRLLAAPAMRPFVSAEHAPGAEQQSEMELLDYCRRTGSSLYHPTCTARMGMDAHAVVDARLRVRGIERLRVVDGSVMPTLVSGNTHAGIVMIGEKAADMIAQDAEAFTAPV